MMVEQRAPKAPPLEARCRYCGEWVSTVPAGTIWTRSRCFARHCPSKGKQQTIYLR